MSDCSEFIYPEYISEYQEAHKAICLNLNRALWNISFLKKAKEAQENGANCKNDFVIGHLYQNEFELLILRLHRTLLDRGKQVITLPFLRKWMFSKYLLPAYKESLTEKLHNCLWDNDETIAARRRLEQNVPIFRNRLIAHTLSGETEEVTISFLDAEKVVVAACDLLEKLSYGVDSFYKGVEKWYLKLKEEKTSGEELLEEFFLFQQVSAYCIKEISCTYDVVDKEELKIAQAKIGRINRILGNNSR